MDLSKLHAFEAEIKKHVPTFKIAFKDETPWMKMLGFFAAPFNQKFMTSYTTTVGNTVYFPSKVAYESNPKSSFTVLAHEFVHMMDSTKYPGWFQFSYALPQVLAPIAFVAYLAAAHQGWMAAVILAVGIILGCLAAKKSVAFFFVIAGIACVAAALVAILFTHWWSALYFVGLTLLAPWPSPGRTRWELRGYTMSLAVMAWTYGVPPTVIRDMTAKHFYGPDYFFMSWSRQSVNDALDAAIVKAGNGDLLPDPAFLIVHEFLLATGDLRIP